ncbi:MAG TPA: glycosyltransferase [Bacteroidota bacterium]|nr:glycosyltransferase [Bacteroidota bacterium]
MNPFLLLLLSILVTAGAIYVRQILLFAKGLSNLRRGTNVSLYTATILVAARNEEAHIERCLTALVDQDYPKEKYRIIVIDDHSTDRTAEIAKSFTNKYPHILLLTVRDSPKGISPKINALNLGVSNSSSELIFTTDADCTVGSRWLSFMVKHFEPNVGAVSGVTLYSDEGQTRSFLNGFQHLDFFSQTACGAGAIGLGSVNNCNGSNMGFRRSAFDAVGGYAAIAHVNSGSDSLLAQRIAATTDWVMQFAFEPETHVTTMPLPSWGNVFQQRMRWAGQTPNYRASTLAFLIASFLFYVSILLLAILSCSSLTALAALLPAFALKMAVDYNIILKFRRLTEIRERLSYFFLSELAHIPVILSAVVGTFLGSFEWKGRHMQREISQQA